MTKLYLCECGTQINIDNLGVGDYFVCAKCGKKRRFVDKSQRTKAADDEDAGGESFGNYRVISLLGKGGMGRVYKARDTALDRPVALKLLTEDLSQNEEFLKRFEREAKVAAGITHPNVVQVYTIGEHESRRYFVMEFVEGTDLDQLRKARGQLPWREATGYILQAARGLEAAQRKGIIHRDIKPANLLCTNDDFIKVADFGLAKGARGGERLQLTTTGVVMGSPHYMSPEQAKGERELDFRTDIYSLGVTLYHLVSGQVPFTASSTMGILLKHLNEPFVPLSTVIPDVPKPLCSTLSRMMSKEPERRYQSYQDLITDLQAALGDGTGTTVPVTPIPVAQEALPLIAGRAIAFLIDALIAALIGGLLWRVLRSHPATLFILYFIFAGGYFVFFWTRKGQTVGCKLLRLRLVTGKLPNVGLENAIIRFALIYPVFFYPVFFAIMTAKTIPAPGAFVVIKALAAVSAACFCGVFFTGGARSVHDMLAKTKLETIA